MNGENKMVKLYSHYLQLVIRLQRLLAKLQILCVLNIFPALTGLLSQKK